MHLFKTRAQSAPTFQLPVDDNESQLGHPDSSLFFVRAPNRAVIIRQCNSMPETGEDQYPANEIKPTLSDGFLFRRKRSEKQVEISRARALEMSERYELSDTKDDSLNKSASFKIPVMGSPSLSATMTAKQAAKVFRKKQLEAKTKTAAAADPLLTERERKEEKRQEQIEQRKVTLARTSPSRQLSRAPFSPLALKQMKTNGRSQNSRFSFAKPHSSKGGKNGGSKIGYMSGHVSLPESMVLEIIPVSPSSVSVAPTEAETPSPRGHQQTLRLPNMC